MCHRRFAGHGIRIRYSDRELAESLGRASRHLHTNHSDAPDLTIDCWRAHDPLMSLPPNDSKVGTVYADDGSVAFTWDEYDGSLFAYDRTHRRGWARFSTPTGPPVWEVAAPFSRILHWWAADRGLQMVHAAAVGNSHGGVLLAGRSGSGKSTTALACMRAGLDFAGDDICLVEPGQPPKLHGLYLSAKGDAETARLLPEFREEFGRSVLNLRTKTILFADESRSGGVLTDFPLVGLVLPRLAGVSKSHLTPIKPAQALRALAPSTLMHTPGNHADGLARLASLVRSLPAWELILGPDPAAAAHLIKDLIDRQASV